MCRLAPRSRTDTLFDGFNEIIVVQRSIESRHRAPSTGMNGAGRQTILSAPPARRLVKWRITRIVSLFYRPGANAEERRQSLTLLSGLRNSPNRYTCSTFYNNGRPVGRSEISQSQDFLPAHFHGVVRNIRFSIEFDSQSRLFS